MVLSKAIGGSLPLALLVYRGDLGPQQPGALAGTFRGNQLAMAAGTATLAHVRKNRLADRAADLGAHMLAQLRALAREFPCVGDVRGRGLMLGVEFVQGEGEVDAAVVQTSSGTHVAPPPAAPELAAAVQRECLRRGLIVELGGPHTSVVRLLPPLTISDEQATAVLDRLADAVDAATRTHTGASRREHHRAERASLPGG
jgi:diaminobutyrate-2-oxoglutarate transaminase